MADQNNLSGIYREIKRRCYNENTLLYKNYGAKGIKICDEWLEDKQNFIDWASLNDYQPGYRLQRYDKSKDYCPSNCYFDITKTCKKYEGRNQFYKKKNAEKKKIKEILGINNVIEHPLYGTFRSMHDRCCNSKNINYKNYGERGITICFEWSGEYGFYNFLAWAKRNNWKNGLTLDRIDSNGNYCPENCRWVTMMEQQNNKRNSPKYNCFNKEMNLTDIAISTKIPIIELRKRIDKGMNIEDAIFDYSFT